VTPSALLFTNAHSAWAMTSKRIIVNTYCQKALSNTMTDGKFLFSGHQINFNSKNSLFVRGLCKAWNDGDPSETKQELVTETLWKGALKENFAKKLTLQQMKETLDMCATEGND
jgi:hypothetical protein